VVENLLGSRGLHREDIRHWAVHPGGDSIITSVRERLGIGEEAMRHTRSVLTDYGNMSSATVWFVLRSILDEGITPGDKIIMLAFGAGMSAHAFLLEAGNESV
ncbi:MAG: 3-oxoacyl-[acyl-carrier-protein] synthase III C-terminal domain-containing protein, partial [Candidatus Latescibacterota bacterium]